jgi:hypothetical protein
MSTTTIASSALLRGHGGESDRRVPPAARDFRARRLPAPVVATGRFALHFLEMCLAMELGMMLFHALVGSALLPADFPALLEPSSPFHGVAMTLSMVLPMVVWMRIRGHGWAMGLEMAIAMVAAWGAVIALCPVVPWLTGAGPTAMYLSMLALMLYRREHYSGAARHPTRAAS